MIAYEDGEETRRRVIELLERRAPVPNLADIDSFDYYESGHVDSLGLMTLVSEIETVFNITLDDEAFLSDDFRTIGGLIAVIEAAEGPQG